MTQIDGKAIAKKLVELTSSLKGLPATDYAGRIHYKAALCRRAMEFRVKSMLDMGTPWPGYDNQPGSPSLAGYAIPDAFNYLAQTAVARAMKDLNSQLQSKIDMVICDEVYNDQMAKLAYLCFVEHINATLHDKPIEVYDDKIISVRKVRDLRDLRMLTWKFDAGFGHNVVGDQMKPLLTYLPFIEKIIEEDAAHGDNLRSMSILFLADFMTGDPYTAENRKDFVFKSSFEILEQWSRALWERKGKGNPSETKKIVAFCGKAATAVYLPSDSSAIPSTYDVTTKVYREITKRDQKHDSYKDEVRQAIKDLIEDDLNTWKSIYQGVSNAWSTASYPYWRDAVKKGMQKDHEAVIKQWVTDGYFWENELPYGSKKMLRKSFARNGAYIVAGNWITLADGSYRKVETLKVNDVLLTSATGDTDPVKVSREMHPMELTAGLIGFNGEEPFATPAQVFHTTTGLRAVNPQAAMKQNPWAKIGRLAVGHILYRHSQNPSAQSEYELDLVKSIERTTPEKRMVFALGLDNGVRSHHVNRYLANVNDPEIRLDDVSALLSKFSAADQMRILSSAKEINPMLNTFDSQTIWERLQIELLEAKSQAMDPWKVSTYSAPFSSPGAYAHILHNDSIMHLAKSYTLIPLEQVPKLPIKSLPVMKLLDGNLLLDDEAQSRVAMSEKDRTVSWTRKIPGEEVYEHGRVEIFTGDETGSGSILYSSEAHPSSLDQGDIINVTVSSTSIGSWERRSESFPTSLLSSESPASSLTGGIKSEWDMTLDKKEWKKGEKRSKPESPVKFGTIFTGTHAIPEEVNIFAATVPVLDEILAAINKDRKSSGKQVLDSLYTSFINRVTEKDEDGETSVVERRFIKVYESSTLLFLSDQGPESTSPFNLTFKKHLGINVTLPVLFQSMYFDRNFAGNEMFGGVFVHDPTMRENKGARYFIHGTWKDPAFGDKADYRVQVSKHFARIATPGTNISNSALFQPAGVTALLASVSPISTEKLYKMPYNSNDVNSLQQVLINEAMFYHMKEDDRKKFTNKELPDPRVIGSELTHQLSRNLSEWLKNVYAPAFITRSITQIDRFKERLQKNGQAEKVWYWWSGNGKKCLSNAKEFNQLNRIASIRAMKQLYKSHLDQDIGTSRQLAQKLYTVISSKPKMDQILEEDDRGDNINRLCAIMYTLQPEEDYSCKWFRLITDRAIARAVYLPFNKDKDGHYVQDYLKDAMTQLITRILSNDPKFAGPVRDQLEKDLEEFMEKNGINKQMSLEKKVSACVALMSAFTVEVAKLLVITGNGLARAFGGSKLFQLAGKLADKAGSAVSRIPLGTKLAKGLGALCVVGYFVGQVLPLVSVIKSWDKLTPAQRAIGILEAIRAVLNATERAVQEFNAWRSPSTSEPVKARESAILDSSLSHEITQPAGEGLFEVGEKLNPEGGVKATMADRLKEGGMPSNDERISGDSQIWSEDKQSTPKKLRPNEKETANKLSATSKWIRALNIVLGFAVAAAMTYSLIEEWDKLTDVGKVISTLSVIVQILAVVVDVLDLVIATGLVVSATLSVAIPIVGAVLALIGIGLMIVSMFVDMYATQPAPSPVDDFINKVIGPLTEHWPNPPGAQLSYEYSKTRGSNESGTVTVSGENKTNETVAILCSQMSVYAGHNDKCLFSDDSFHLSTDKEAKEGGTVSTAPENLVFPTLAPTLLQEKRPEKFWVHNLSLKGVLDEKTNPMSSIKLEKGKKLSAAWTGKLKAKSTIDIIEVFTNGDKAHRILQVTL
ncbi:hypothetical protein JDV02_005034 [Purpureocillium takamizusanense]|uniref:Uncharacterized protein n=1 Tax=Purpureocillium takamizusanense TaxID=2060973 RepID=A0A9Q8VBD5_9HYPO|nr:uncharacterized protein JDV02_005034 [Purpureocillium takamizusanense]UNI18784.1 hypothetical protein JDV02_005034 [Purpureocillium takamizusanense]